MSRAFGRTFGVHDLSFRLRAGEVVAVLGPNGSGKTTLLQLLSTLDRPTAGAITFGAAVDAVRHRAVVRPHVAIVGHETMVYGELTGAENLAFAADLHDLAADRGTVWLDRVGLGHAAGVPVAAYSRGMRQRLALARALMTEPTLVLLDEPLTGLDAAGRVLLAAMIDELRAADRIVVMVTHHLDWPAEAVDRVLVVEGGSLRFDGRPGLDLAALYAREVRT